MAELLSRRAFLRQASLASVGFAALLAGCQPKVVEKVVEKEVTKVVKETVEVEKVVEKEVEKVVKETVVIEATPAQKAPENVEIVGWTVHGFEGSAEVNAYGDAWVERWQDEFPHATFKYQAMGWDEQLRQNLVTALLGGTGPDIIVGENYIQAYAELGAFLPMDEALVDIKDNMIPGTYASAVLEGKTYGCSQLTGLYGFEGNPQVIEKAGLDPKATPKTWDELLTQCEQITKAGNQQYYGISILGTKNSLYGAALQFVIFLKQAGADFCKDDCTYPWYDNPKAEVVWDFYRKLHQFSPPGLSLDPNAGTIFSAIWQGLTAYAVGFSGFGDKWPTEMGRVWDPLYMDIPLLPGGQKTSVCVGNVILSVLSGTKHPEEALGFCRVSQDDDVQLMVYDAYGRLPTTYSACEKIRPKLPAYQQTFLDILVTADLTILPQWRKNHQKLWEILNDMFTNITTTEKPIRQLMSEAQQAADEVMRS